MSINFIEKARQFAHEAHDSIGQKRKYTGAPYWVHTDAVSDLVAKYISDPEVIAAANLHDVLEDVFPMNAHYSPELIGYKFGNTVLAYVFDLTDIYSKERCPNLNRKERKALEVERISAVHPNSKSIKLADICSNSWDISANDKGFAVKYLREKADLLTVLGDASSPELLVLAHHTLREAQKQLSTN